jgi:hypothetical protein
MPAVCVLVTEYFTRSARSAIAKVGEDAADQIDVAHRFGGWAAGHDRSMLHSRWVVIKQNRRRRAVLHDGLVAVVKIADADPRGEVIVYGLDAGRGRRRWRRCSI